MLSLKQCFVAGTIASIVLVGLIFTLHLFILPEYQNHTSGAIYEYQISIFGKSGTRYPLIETFFSSDSHEIQIDILRDSSGFAENERNFKVAINSSDNTIATDDPTPIIPEIQPELPGLSEYLHKSPNYLATKNWTLMRNGTYLVNDTTIEYSVTATGTYENFGREQIHVEAGNFDCTVVNGTSEFVLSQVINGPKGRVWIDTRGEITRSIWIDIKNGIVVKSENFINKTVTIDQHEIFKSMGLGIDQMYREIPSNSRIICELVKIGYAQPTLSLSNVQKNISFSRDF